MYGCLLLIRRGRHVGFDQIPAGLVSQIIITKANTADMDAEALGGTIELTPRSAFDLNQPFLEGHVGSGWEPLRHQYGIIDDAVVGGLTFGFGPGGNPFAPAPVSAIAPTPDGKSVDTKNVGSGEGPITPYRPFGVLGEFSFYEDHRGVDDFEPAYSDSNTAHWRRQNSKRHRLPPLYLQPNPARFRRHLRFSTG